MTFYEFFAGAGMARAGLGPRWACAFANDIDPMKARAYSDTWGKAGLVVCDVARLKPSDLPGVANLPWGSPPCVGASEAGKGEGLGPEAWAFLALMRALRQGDRAPRTIVVENVTGLLTSRKGQDFDAICNALVDAGYRFGAVVIDAAYFVPQSRERVFIIAVDAAAPLPVALVGNEASLFHSPALIAACARHHEPTPPTRNTISADIIEDEPTGVPWHTRAETDRLIGMMTPVHLDRLEAAKRAGRPMVGGLYKRTRSERGVKHQRAEVRFDDVAGCLRVPSGGSSRQTVMIVDSDLVRSRLLSPRELARLMGLPDDYQLPTHYNDAYALMGDGVVAPVVRYLAEHVLESLVKAVLANAVPGAGEAGVGRAAKENAH
jgi:DNA (cytosine-5)-methyltransferase 1